MSFVVTKRPVAAFPISLVVNGTNGDPLEISFVAQYHRHTPEQLADLTDGMVNKARATQNLPPLLRPNGSQAPEYPYSSDLEFVQAKLANWLGVRDAAGDSVTFSRESLQAVITDWPELIAPLFSGFYSAHQGAQKKN